MIVSPAGFCRVAAGCLNYFLILHPASFGSFLFPGFCWCYPCGPQGLFSICRVGGSNPRGTRRSPWESPDAPAVGKHSPIRSDAGHRPRRGFPAPAWSDSGSFPRLPGIFPDRIGESHDKGETSKSYRDLCFACPSNVLGSPADKQTEA